MLIIPSSFLEVQYNSDINPDNLPKDFSKLENGANCLIFVYALLKHYGYNPPILWPIELWNDIEFTKKTTYFETMDILFYGNNKEDMYWSHLALYIGNKKVIHLSKKNNLPEICDFGELVSRKSYDFLFGAKRLLSN